MPLVPLPWQERTGEGSAQIVYSELMSRDGASRVVVDAKFDLDGNVEYWSLYFGMSVNVRLYLTEATVLELVKQIGAKR